MNYQNLTALDMGIAASLILINGALSLALRLGLERQWLHAVQLGFTHPGTGKWFEARAPYPDDLQHALERLQG